MTPRERVLTSLSHRTPDRAPCDYLGTPEIDDKLKSHFRTESMDEVLEKLNVDLRAVDAPYIGPALKTWPDGRYENFWGHIRKPIRNEAGSYDESVEFPYAAFESVEDVRSYRWPRPEWFDYSRLAADCEKYDGYAVVFGSPGNMDVINGTAFGRGVERVLMDIGLENPVGLECMEIRSRFCYERTEIALKAAAGRIDILWIGDDYGTQKGLLVGPAVWRKLFFPKLKAMCDLGHRYGARVMLHSCGSTRRIWPQLIEAGVDIYDTVQPEAANMDPAGLKAEFGDRISFHGTISTQKTLPFGTAEDVANEVRERIRTVGRDGGLIVAPAHNIQPDTPLENVLALYGAVHSIKSGS